MEIYYKNQSRFQEIFFICFVLSLVASSAWAQSNLFQGAPSGRMFSDSRSKADSPAPATLAENSRNTFERESLIRSFINKSLFPNIDELSSGQENEFFNMKLLASDFETLKLSGATSWDMSLTERKARESAAKDQAYRVMSNMLFSIKPVARLRDMLEPYTRPLELYQSKNGTISPNYLGQKISHSTGDVRIFAVTLGVSPSHNLNVMADIYDRFTVSVLDGNRLITHYLIPESGHKIGFETNTRSELLFIYSMEF